MLIIFVSASLESSERTAMKWLPWSVMNHLRHWSGLCQYW